MNLTFKLCNPLHLDLLEAISRKSFIDAFEKDNNPQDFYNYVDKAFSKDALKKELSNPDMAFYFLYSDDVLAGYFKLNESGAQTEKLNQSSIELERIYVLSKFQGKHFGEMMLNKAKQISKEKQVDFLWLGVWENNTKAIRFYERHGFKTFGSHPFYIGSDRQIDLLMKLELV